MRFVFVDEAGTSAKEPVTVVVGLIVDADRLLSSIEAAVTEVVKSIPEEVRKLPKFVFHATEIWGNKRLRDGWSKDDRLGLLCSMMSLVHRLKIPIVMSMVRRGTIPPEVALPPGLSRAQFDHAMAYSNCIATADRYIRTYGGPDEVGAVIAEDIPEMRKQLAIAQDIFRHHPTTIPPEYLEPTQREKDQGFLYQSTDIRVARIRTNPQFVPKGDPLLLLADAVAFGFRRFLAEQSYGDDFVRAILGGRLRIDDYRGGMAFDLFYTHVHPRQT